MQLLTYGTGWLAVAVLSAAIAGSFLIRWVTRRNPRRRGWRAHYWLGSVAVAVAVTHALASITQGTFPVPVVVGLWVASAGLWIVVLQLGVGGLLVRAAGKERRRLRRGHLWVTLAIVGLVALHVILNWRYVSPGAP